MRRIRPLRPLLAVVTLSLASCGTATTDTGACPTPVVYSHEQQDRAAAELETLPLGSVLTIMVEDYGRERAQLRACRRGGATLGR